MMFLIKGKIVTFKGAKAGLIFKTKRVSFSKTSSLYASASNARTKRSNPTDGSKHKVNIFH